MAKMYAKIKCNRRNWNLRVSTFDMLPIPADIKYSTIYLAYDRPSEVKISAYHDCCELADCISRYFHTIELCIPDTNEGICSKNPRVFTYGCNYYFDHKLVGRLYVTRTGATLSICENYLQSFCDTFNVKI